MNTLDTTSSVADTASEDSKSSSQEDSKTSSDNSSANKHTVVGGMTLKKRTGPPSPNSGAARPAGSRAPGAPRPAGAPSRPGGPPMLTPKPVSKRMERFSRVLPSRDPGVRMNEQIRAPEVRVINDEGEMVGVMTPKAAIEIARGKNMDLIEIVPNAKPPVCKIIEFGKWKYEQQKKEKQAKKSSHQQLVKEVRFHPRTDTHDFEFKVRHARNFIEEGHKVKAYVQFKGREVNYKQFGEELLANFKARMEDVAKVDQDVSMMGRMMSMVLSPLSKKKPAGEKPVGEKPEKPAKAKSEPIAAEANSGESLASSDEAE